MARTARDSSDGADSPKLLVNAPNATELSHHQLSQLLTVMGTLGPFLITRHGQGDMEVPDEDVRLSAASTFIRTCNALDSILDDKKRWSSERADMVDEAILRLHKMQEEVARQHAEMIGAARRPSMFLHPIFLQLQDGRWMCAHGSNSTLLGLGDTPELAARDFDRTFFLRREDQPVEAVKAAPVVTKKRKYAKRKKVDK